MGHATQHQAKETRLPSRPPKVEDSARRSTETIVRDANTGFALAFAIVVSSMALQAASVALPPGTLPPASAPFSVAAAIVVSLILGAVLAVLARRVRRNLSIAQEAYTDLREAYDRARLDSLLDALTGLGNHRAFQEELDVRIAGAREDGSHIALLMIDVDDL
jgi:predicted signal transduction protein with EAL and GGDEF domain